MITITYLHMICFITLAWIVARIIVCTVNKKFVLKRELKLLMVYVCIVVICRMVYFPLHHVDGHIGTLTFDKNRVFPFWTNIRPFTFIWERYDGWKVNIFGNITMFIPVGIVWPVCFKKLNNLPKALLAGTAFPLLIEISQLPFFDRCSDIDDVILNTTGFAIGALIYFAVSRMSKKREY